MPRIRVIEEQRRAAWVEAAEAAEAAARIARESALQPSPPEGQRIPNRFSGTCDVCGLRVGREEGFLVPRERPLVRAGRPPSRFTIRHHECVVPTDPELQRLLDEEERIEERTRGEIPDGYYTLNDVGYVRHYRVRQQRWGREVRRVGAGGTFPGPRLSSLAEEDFIDRVRIAGVENSRRLYAERTVRCYVCGRMLTDPTSIQLGIGPTCRQHVQAELEGRTSTEWRQMTVTGRRPRRTVSAGPRRTVREPEPEVYKSELGTDEDL